MSGHFLHKCPTCYRHFDQDAHARMGLRNNLTINSLCPGRVSVSDIDNVLHNGRSSPERLALIEYKDGNAQVKGGQKWVLDSMQGDWVDIPTGRRIQVRWFELPLHVEDETAAVAPVVGWVFP